MARWIVPALAVLGGLIAWDRAAATRDVRTRAHDPVIERLAPREALAGRTAAAVTIERPQDGGSLFYARKRGVWRCREAFGAVADERAVEELLASLLGARGVVRTDDPARAAAYGFDDAVTVVLHGPKVLERPDRDVIAAFELGASVTRDGRSSAFVRASGSARILEIDRDPRATLAQNGDSALPPLIDTHLLAGSTPAGFHGFERLEFAFADGQGYRVESHPSATADAPPDWTVVVGSVESPCPEYRVGGYTGVWLRERLQSVANPARASELGLDPPFATIELTPHGAEPIRFAVGAPTSDGRAYVWNKTTNSVWAISREIFAKLVPDADMFRDATRPNPWERWLSK